MHPGWWGQGRLKEFKEKNIGPDPQWRAAAAHGAWPICNNLGFVFSTIMEEWPCAKCTHTCQVGQDLLVSPWAIDNRISSGAVASALD